jgi:esterase
MKLFFKKNGEGKPVIILHGLFGLSDNWMTIAKTLADKGFCCYSVDQRNHGRSGHDHEFNYPVMAEDVHELMSDEKIVKSHFIGHSMGGKTAMFFAEKYPLLIDKMIIADMSPRYYPPHHQAVLAALKSVDPATLTSRKEAEEKLRSVLKDEGTIQFLLKNLYWNDQEKLAWRFGLEEIEENIEEVGKEFSPKGKIDIDVLFLRGGRSGYIGEEDVSGIKNIFPRAKIETIEDAGHWVHAEKPKEFVEKTLSFFMP